MKKLYFFVLLFLVGCSTVQKFSHQEEKELTIKLDSLQIKIVNELKITQDSLIALIEKPIYKMKAQEVDAYLKYLSRYEPNLSQRIKIIAKKNLGQPYKIYLLGEFPVEVYPDVHVGGLYPTDILGTQPTFTLEKSDCVVFCEHTYSMALAKNWKQFYAYLQRIRYKDGEISFLTRNHFTEYDWDNNNSWLVKDFMDDIPQKFTKTIKTTINKANFFKRYNIGQNIQPITFEWKYIPLKYVDSVMSYLNTGDFVNYVRGFGDDASTYVGHTGIIIKENDTVYVINSTEPQVRIDKLSEVVANGIKIYDEKIDYNKNNTKKKPILYGFRFLKLQNNPYENLKKIDGERAPVVKILGN
jgi:hypothetical protein